MLRDVPRSLTKRVRRNGKRFVGASLLLLLLAGVSGFVAAQDVDVSIESLHIGWVETASAQDRSSLALDQALIGDTIRLSATVKNLGTGTASQFNVDFFFTETISGEHGKIGSQAVIGLSPGEERRPVVTFDSTAFAPGIYVFSAEADPERVNSESERCNNFAPLGECAGDLLQSEDRYKLALLQAGSHISELSLTTEFTICQMGPLTKTLIVEAYNVGTEAFSFTGTDVAVYGYYRLSLDPPANGFNALLEDTTGSPQPLTKIVSLSSPGDEGFIRITLDYDELSAQFQPSDNAIESGEVLGRANPAQIRLSVNPLAGGTPQDLYLPAQFALARFYSEVDLWTFPARTHCLCDDYTDIDSASVAPVTAGGLVFYAVSTGSGDRLHVLKVRTGEEKSLPWTPPSGVGILAIAAAYDATAEVYRTYIGASDGRLYALEGIEEDEGEFLQQSWVSDSAALVSGNVHLVLVEASTRILAGSASGAYIVDAVTGEVLRSHATYDVSAAPTYSVESQTLWVAQDEFVYGLNSTGSVCEFDALDLVTTPLLISGDGTTIFFGTDQGTLYAIDAAGVGGTCTSKDAIEPGGLRTIIGMAIVSADEDAVLYMAGDTGVMGRIEYDYDDDPGFENYEESVRAYEPTGIELSPAILANDNGDDALAISFVGETRDGRITRPILQTMEKDLSKYELVSIWGSSVPFVFKPEEEDVAPAALLSPVIDRETVTLLVASSDGYLYAFDLSQFE